MFERWTELMRHPPMLIAAMAGIVLVAVTGSWLIAENNNTPAANPAPSPDSVTITDAQLPSFKLVTVGQRLFRPERQAVGSIDFNEDRSVQVFPPYQGKIITTDAALGEEVRKGQTLYTIESPDLIAAESTLIGAAAQLALTDAALARAKLLLPTQGIAQKDYDQAVSDQKTAEGALAAARNNVRVFGKTDREIDAIVAAGKIDPALVVVSPIAGEITVRDAQPGLLAQPGAAPAPYTVSDLSTEWMMAYVNEDDSPFLHVGQPVMVNVSAFPGQVFRGTIAVVSAFVDPNTHRVAVRSLIEDRRDQLRPGMLASFVIGTAAPTRSTALPVNGIVREGDGTMTAWVTMDRRHFIRRTVRVGIEQGGYDQILSGLSPGELAVTDGAIFMSNMANAPATD